MTDQKDPPTTPRDRACAVFARAALFPISVDWSGKHHAIHPALQALDLVRKDAVNLKDISFSKLFPRHVIVVPSPTGGMQWNGQPDIVDSTVEAIPNVLTVKCMDCSDSTGANAYVRTKEDYAKKISHEIVLCTNRVLKSDYNHSSDPTMLEQRKDLPAHTLTVVDEALAHHITKIREEQSVPKKLSPCEKMAHLEVQAARLAECLYQEHGGEVHRGSALKPLGFSLLPGSVQRNFRDRCVRAVATKATAAEFGAAEAKVCVEGTLASSNQ